MKLLALTRTVTGYAISCHLAMLRFAVARKTAQLTKAQENQTIADVAWRAARAQVDVAKSSVANARAQRSSLVRAAAIEAASYGQEVTYA